MHAKKKGTQKGVYMSPNELPKVSKNENYVRCPLRNRKLEEKKGYSIFENQSYDWIEDKKQKYNIK